MTPLSKNSRHSTLPLVRDGWRFIIPALLATLVFAVIGWWPLAILFAVLLMFVTYFFRDPERAVPRQPSLILSPADGAVLYIDEVETETYDGRVEKLRRVGIFLSIFNVHVQRTPTYGRVRKVEYRPGKFHNALKAESSEENESNMIWMRGNVGTVGVRQIAGVIARRVLCHLSVGEHVLAGQRLGLIRFGSRVEAFFPLEAEVRTEVGRKVRGGLSVLAEMPPESLNMVRDEPARETTEQDAP